MNCPKCQGKKVRLDGKAHGRQRYFCKNCSYRYTVTRRSSEGDPQTKRLALHLYLEGDGFRKIGRLLKFSNVTILNWIRSYGKELEELRASGPVSVVEIDEMHSYIGSKKNNAGYGLLLIDMGKNSSDVLWVPGELLQAESSGNKSSTP